MNTLASRIPRLRQMLLMLSSDQPGETAAAAAAIGRALKSAGADWHDLADGLLAKPAQAAPFRADNRRRTNSGEMPDDWRELHEFCAQHEELLRPREAEFITSLGEWRGTPTEKQMAWLVSIYARLCRQTAQP